MLDHEVIVRPLLESRVIFRIVLIARAFQRPVKVRDVFVKNVTRRQIRAAAKPPSSRRPRVVSRRISFKVTIVKVHGRCHRVDWVHHRGNPGCKKRNRLRPGALPSRRRSVRLRRHLPVHHGHVNPGFFKNLAALQHSRDASTPARSFPRVLVKLSPV